MKPEIVHSARSSDPCCGKIYKFTKKFPPTWRHLRDAEFSCWWLINRFATRFHWASRSFNWLRKSFALIAHRMGWRRRRRFNKICRIQTSKKKTFNWRKYFLSFAIYLLATRWPQEFYANRKSKTAHSQSLDSEWLLFDERRLDDSVENQPTRIPSARDFGGLGTCPALTSQSLDSLLDTLQIAPVHFDWMWTKVFQKK